MESLVPFLLFFVVGFIVLIIGRILIMRVSEDPEKKKKSSHDS